MTRVLAARIASLLFVIVVVGCAAEAQRPSGGELHWVSSWGSAQMVPDEKLLPADDWRDASLRQVVRVSLGGQRLRVRLSNVFGTSPLLVEGASIARALKPGLSNIDPASLRPLTFAGKASVLIPPGEEHYTDPVALEHSARTDFAVSLHFKDPPARQTAHPGSRTTTFVTKGNRVAAESWPESRKIVGWYQLADIEVEAPRSVPVVVAIGDSITDGAGSTTDGNDRWTDALVLRMHREGMPAMGVMNAGIGGNRLLMQGMGPPVTSRFDRDVLTRSGVSHVIVLIGVNDFGALRRTSGDTPAARAKLVDDMLAAYRQLVDRAHAHRICVIGATILPYTGSDFYTPNEENEKDRQQVNQWIRTSGVFDAIADFDAATRDPAKPERMRKEHDIGDGLHPSPAGFRAMAEAVPLAALRECSPNRGR